MESNELFYSTLREGMKLVEFYQILRGINLKWFLQWEKRDTNWSIESIKENFSIEWNLFNFPNNGQEREKLVEMFRNWNFWYYSTSL